MVFYFTSTVVSPPMTIYMGRDKHENEELIRWGWPEDIWFHTDKLSSAHVYVRLPRGHTIDDIPSAVLEDCVQLTKANSIQGCKQNNVPVVYTPWANLKKTGSMDVGQVGFHKEKDVRTIIVEKKINDVLNRLNKTKVEKEVNFRQERERRDQEERHEARKKQLEEKDKEREENRVKRELDDQRCYKSLMTDGNMQSNKEAPVDEDDFM